jgi:FAD/FMN-containing dehydrogenase
MQRRQLLGAGLAMAGASALRAGPARAAAIARVRPGAPGWPADADWAQLSQAVGRRLSRVPQPDLAGPDAAKQLANPFFVADTPALTESSGWLDAWRSQPSAWMVDAHGTADVAAAVRFAAAHNLRLVIKGRGHSYLGGSNAPDSLLIWTRHMDDVTVHEAFTPAGSSAPPVPAISCGAGAMWMHAYRAASVDAGRYVQGGGCTTVGVAGLVQGGGFGSLSKGFGTAGASLIEAEVVTADGKVRVVNHAQDPDLYWALKGGGGGTFGAVTRLTLATHPLPETIGAIDLSIRAKSDDAFHRLLARFVALAGASLINPHFGEQARATMGNQLVISMTSQGISQAEARAAFQPLVDFANASPADYEGQNQFLVAALPARRFWDGAFMKQLPGVVHPDTRPEATPNDYWWTGDGDQVGVFWHAYTSAWLPASLLQPANQAKLVDAWFAASRHWTVAFHFNKGLAGAPPEAIAASRDTPINPEALTAFALALIADAGPSLFTGATINPAAHARADRVHASMKALLACAPGAGSYVNETDYFQEDWQHAFWGPHYPRLLRAKRRYDPAGLFTVHHGVGSEAWSADGFTRSSTA